MPGPPPKPEGARARRNKKSTAAELVANPTAEIPALPPNPPATNVDIALHGGPPPWHPAVLDEWAQIWRSPMASQYTAVDAHGLLQLMVLYQRFWTEPSVDIQRQLHAEIRISRRDFGLTPMARANLHWQIIETEERAERHVARQRARPDNEAALDVLDG